MACVSTLTIFGLSRVILKTGVSRLTLVNEQFEKVRKNCYPLDRAIQPSYNAGPGMTKL